MKIPEKAPDWMQILRDNSSEVIGLASDMANKKIWQEANTRYVYWDKFKYYPFKEGISPEFAWAYLKFNRIGQMKHLVAKDKSQKPFLYWLPDVVLEQLHFIDQNAGGHILVDDPNIDIERERYLINSLMEEAIASSQLEGAATTRKKAKEMLRSGRKPKNKAEQMIINNYITIRRIKSYINKPLTIALLKNIQTSITKNTLEERQSPGQFRNGRDEYYVVDSRDGQTLFNPPLFSEIDERLEALCRFANQEDSDNFIHPILKAIILHFWLAYIHPFPDGNGRTARALFYWYALKQGYWMFEYLTISKMILKNPIQYAKAYLYSEMDDGDITYFIIFNLNVIHLAMDALKEYLMKQQIKFRKTRRFLKKYPGLNHRQQDILHHALIRPDDGYSIKYYQNRFGVVYETARYDLSDLAKKRLFKKIREGKTYYFVPESNIHDKLRSPKK